MFYYLKEDVNSYNKKSYALKGEKVTIISDHDNCVIVESLESKIRFGINKNFLSEILITKDTQIKNLKTKK